MYPNVVAEFVFDQSSAHGAFAKDALNAKDMNVRPGGKQCKMHDTFIPINNPNLSLRGKLQTMNFPADLPLGHLDYPFRGQPKGMHRILEERGLISVLADVNGGKVTGECATCKLSCKQQERQLREAWVTVEGADEPAETTVDIAQELLRTDCCM
jgi:hypothetical protein